MFYYTQYSRPHTRFLFMLSDFHLAFFCTFVQCTTHYRTTAFVCFKDSTLVGGQLYLAGGVIFGYPPQVQIRA
jgi:hypothetical protein